MLFHQLLQIGKGLIVKNPADGPHAMSLRARNLSMEFLGEMHIASDVPITLQAVTG